MKVKIYGIDYKVSFVDELIDPENQNKLWGDISYINKHIRILKDAPTDQKEQTLIHEILHGVVQAGVIRELMDEKFYQYEIPVTQIAIGLTMALKSLGIKIPVK